MYVERDRRRDPRKRRLVSLEDDHESSATRSRQLTACESSSRALLVQPDDARPDQFLPTHSPRQLSKPLLARRHVERVPLQASTRSSTAGRPPTTGSICTLGSLEESSFPPLSWSWSCFSSPSRLPNSARQNRTSQSDWGSPTQPLAWPPVPSDFLLHPVKAWGRIVDAHARAREAAKDSSISPGDENIIEVRVPPTYQLFELGGRSGNVVVRVFGGSDSRLLVESSSDYEVRLAVERGWRVIACDGLRASGGEIMQRALNAKNEGRDCVIAFVIDKRSSLHGKDLQIAKARFMLREALDNKSLVELGELKESERQKYLKNIRIQKLVVSACAVLEAEVLLGKKHGSSAQVSQDLLIAVRSGEPDRVRMVMQLEYFCSDLCLQRDGHGNVPLHHAPDTTIVQLLIDVEPRALEIPNGHGQKPVHSFLKRRPFDAQAVDVFIGDPANLWELDADGISAAMRTERDARAKVSAMVAPWAQFQAALEREAAVDMEAALNMLSIPQGVSWLDVLAFHCFGDGRTLSGRHSTRSRSRLHVVWTALERLFQAVEASDQTAVDICRRILTATKGPKIVRDAQSGCWDPREPYREQLTRAAWCLQMSIGKCLIDIYDHELSGEAAEWVKGERDSLAYDCGCNQHVPLRELCLEPRLHFRLQPPSWLHKDGADIGQVMEDLIKFGVIGANESNDSVYDLLQVAAGSEDVDSRFSHEDGILARWYAAWLRGVCGAYQYEVKQGIQELLGPSAVEGVNFFVRKEPKGLKRICEKMAVEILEIIHSLDKPRHHDIRPSGTRNFEELDAGTTTPDLSRNLSGTLGRNATGMPRMLSPSPRGSQRRSLTEAPDLLSRTLSRDAAGMPRMLAPSSRPSLRQSRSLRRQVTPSRASTNEDLDQNAEQNARWSPHGRGSPQSEGVSRDDKIKLLLRQAAIFITDINGCTYVVPGIEDLKATVNHIRQVHDSRGTTLRRTKNMFHRSFNSVAGYRDFKLWLEPNGPETLCEVQVLLQKYKDEKKRMHLPYEYFRGSLDWPNMLDSITALSERMRIQHEEQVLKDLRAAEAERPAITAWELKAKGFSAIWLRNAGFTARQLKEAGYTARDLLDAEYPIGLLVDIGFTCQELWDAECTVRQMREEGFTIASLKACGCTVRELKEDGCSAQELSDVGYILTELYDEGYGYLASELLGLGCTLSDLHDAGYDGSELRQAGFSANELKEIGYTTANLHDAGYTLHELKAAGEIAKDLSDLGYGILELTEVGFAARDVVAAGFTVQELKEAGYGARNLRDQNWTADELRSGTYSLLELKEAGYTARQLTETGCIIPELIQTGFTLVELKEEEYSAHELTEVGCTAQELKSASFTAKELNDAGHGAFQLKEAGFTCRELWNAGSLSSKLRGAGFTCLDLKEAGCRLQDLESAGFKAVDFKEAGYTAAELVTAGYTARQLKEVGYSARNLKEAQYKIRELQISGFQIRELFGAFGRDDFENEGFSLANLKRIGCSASDLTQVGYKARELGAVGFTIQQLGEAGWTASLLRDQGYTCEELKDAGMAASELQAALFTREELENSGFNCGDLREAGYAATSLRKAGHTVEQLQEAGYSAKELKDAGCSLQELESAGYVLEHLEEAGYSAEELQKTGYSATELKQAGFQLEELTKTDFSVSDMKEAGFSARQFKDMGFPLQELKEAGYTAVELKEAGFTIRQLGAAHFSHQELLDTGATARELWDSGVSATQLRDDKFEAHDIMALGASAAQLLEAGYVPKQLKQAGFKLEDLEEAGCTGKQLRTAGFNAYQLIEKGYTIEALREVGYSATQLKEAGCTAMEIKEVGYSLPHIVEAAFGAVPLRQAGFSPAQLRIVGHFTALELRDAGFVLVNFKDSDYSAQELEAAGFTLQELGTIGFTGRHFRAAGYTAFQLLVAGHTAKYLRGSGYPAKELKEAGYDAQQVMEGGYTALQAILAGFTPSELAGAFDWRDLQNAGFTAKEFRHALFSAARVKEMGYTVTQLREGGYTAQELKDVGFSHEQLKRGTFTAKELKDANFLVEQLQQAGYAAEDMEEAGYDVQDLKLAKYTASQLKQSGHSADELKKAGYTASELNEAGYSLEEIVFAGYDLKHLKTAGFTDHLRLKELGFDVKSLREEFGFGHA